MLTEQTLNLLRVNKLSGMADAYEHQLANPSLQSSPFDDRFSMLVDAEISSREMRKQRRLERKAKLKINAQPESIDYTVARGLDKRFQSLISCDWILRGQHVIITGPTGVGKTHLACALGNQAVRKGIPILYFRFAHLLEHYELARGEGTLPKLRGHLGRHRLIIVDDWGMISLNAQHKQDLLDFFDDRTEGSSVLVASQLPIKKWHQYVDEPTLADAIIDRITAAAHEFELRGESMRRMKAK